MNVLPLLTTLVAFAFTVALARQYLERRKIHQIVWTVAMLFYAISALMEFLMNVDVYGPNVTLFRIYYVLSAPIAGFLGAGVVYLLAPKRIAHIFMGFIGILSILLMATGLTVPLNQDVIIKSFNGPLGEAFRASVSAYGMDVRIYSIVINIVGGLALIGGAAFSYLRDRRRTYNILIFFGGVLPMIGGGMLGLLGDPNIFFEFELLGTIFLFLGFYYSDKFIKNREAIIAKAQSEAATKMKPPSNP
jgi:hypothetical protein